MSPNPYGDLNNKILKKQNKLTWSMFNTYYKTRTTDDQPCLCYNRL